MFTRHRHKSSLYHPFPTFFPSQLGLIFTMNLPYISACTDIIFIPGEVSTDLLLGDGKTYT